MKRVLILNGDGTALENIATRRALEYFYCIATMFNIGRHQDYLDVFCGKRNFNYDYLIIGCHAGNGFAENSRSYKLHSSRPENQQVTQNADLRTVQKLRIKCLADKAELHGCYEIFYGVYRISCKAGRIDGLRRGNHRQFLERYNGNSSDSRFGYHLTSNRREK